MKIPLFVELMKCKECRNTLEIKGNDVVHIFMDNKNEEEAKATTKDWFWCQQDCVQHQNLSELLGNELKYLHSLNVGESEPTGKVKVTRFELGVEVIGNYNENNSTFFK